MPPIADASYPFPQGQPFPPQRERSGRGSPPAASALSSQVGGPPGEPAFPRPDFEQQVLQGPEGAKRPTRHSPYRHPDDRDQPDAAEGDSPSRREVLHRPDGAGKKDGGTGIAVERGRTDLFRRSLVEAGSEESLDVRVGQERPQPLEDPQHKDRHGVTRPRCRRVEGAPRSAAPRRTPPGTNSGQAVPPRSEQ